MRHAPTVFLALAAAAALLVPALVRTDCEAQDKPPAPAEGPARTARIYDLTGLRSPSAAHTGAVSLMTARPFGFAPANRTVEEPEAAEPVPGISQVEEILRSLLPGELAESTEISSHDYTLRIRATADAHRRLAQAIESLRRSLGTPYELEVRAATLEDGPAADALLAEVEAAPPGSVADDLVRRVLAADTGGGVRGGSVAAHDGRWTSVESVRTRTVVSDWDVEIAQAASISDPIPQPLEDGLRAAVRAARMHDGRALVSFSAGTADVVEPFRRVEMRTKDLGSCEMPEVRGAWATSAAPMREGETLAFVLSSPVSERAAVRRVIFVRLVSQPPAPDLAPVAIVPVGAVSVPWAQAFLRVPGSFTTNDERLRWGLELEVFEGSSFPVEYVVESVTASATAVFERQGNSIAGVSDWPGGGAVIVHGDQAARDAAHTTVAEIEKERVRAARVSVRLVARVRGGGGDRTLGVLSGPALLGRNVAMAAYTSVPYVADYDVEVAQEARIADPRVTAAVGGTVLNLMLSQGPGTALRADLELIAAGVGEVEASSASGTEVGLIERIPLRRARAAQGVVLEAGKPKEIDLGANPWGAGRLIAVVRAERVGEK